MEKTFFYVHDMHGHSLITSKKLEEEFGHLKLSELFKEKVTERFIDFCDKEAPNLGVMKLRAKVMEKRDNKKVSVKIFPKHYPLPNSTINFIKERIVDNHSIISMSAENDLVKSDKLKFEIDGTNYSFEIIKEE